MEEHVMRKNKNKMIITLTLTLLFAVGMLFGCGKTEQSTEVVQDEQSPLSENVSLEKKVIRVANFPASIWNAQFIVAYQNGLFDKVFADQNVSVEVIEFQNGPAANEAFIAGDIDIVNGIGDQPIVIGIGNGVETTILAGAAKQGKNIGIVAPANIGIQSVGDLKGKKIGVFVGTYVHKSLIGILNDAGISEEDVEIVNITSTSDADAAFASNDIDAYLAMSAYYIHTKVDIEGFIKVADCSKHPAYSYIVAADSFVAENADIVKSFLEALYEAELWLNENKDKSYDVVAEFSGLETERVKYTNQDADIILEWDEDYEQNLYDTNIFLAQHGMIATQLSDEEIKKHIDTSVLSTLYLD